MKAFDLKREDFKTEEDFYKAKVELFKKESKEYWKKINLRESMGDELIISIYERFINCKN